MSERDEKRGGGSGCLILGVVLIIFVVLYLAGIGPAAVVARANPTAAQWLEVIYFPVGWLGQHCQPLQDVFGSYIELWTG